MGGPFDVGVVAGGMHVRLDRFGDCIGAGEDLALAEAGRTVAGDAEELLYYIPCLDTASPGQRDHPSESFRLRGSAAARLAHGGEKLEQTVLVLVDRDVERTAAGLHLVGPALERLGPLALVGTFLLGDRNRRLDLLLLLAGGEDLLVTGAVPVDRYTLAAGLVGQTVDLFDVFEGRL